METNQALRKNFSLQAAERERIVISLTDLAALGGYAVVPYNCVYYDQPGYGAPVYAAQPVYVAPVVNLGLSYHSPGYYGGGAYHGRW